MTNSYILVSRRKTGQTAFIYINNTPRTGKTRRFPAVFGKKAICPSLCRKVWQIDESISEFLHKYAKNAKNLKKVFLILKKELFAFPRQTEAKGLSHLFLLFGFCRIKLYFTEIRKNAPSCGKDTAEKPSFPDAKMRRESGKVLHIINIYSAVRPEKTASSKRRAARKKIRKRCRGAAPFRYFHSHSMVATGFGERS